MATVTQKQAPSKYDHLMTQCQRHAAVRTAVAHPCSDAALSAAVEAAKLRLIEPILVGPEKKIRDAAGAGGLNIEKLQIVDQPHSTPRPTRPSSWCAAERRSSS